MITNDLAQLFAAWRRRSGATHTGYIGWVGRENLGDDAMFDAAMGLLAGRAELLQTLNRERMLDRMRAGGAKAFGSVVLGGGTLINEARLPMVEWLLEHDIPLFAMGTGVGSAGFSMADEELDPRWTEALAQFRKIGVRGPLSLKKLNDAGVTNAQIVGDLALALTPDRSIADYASKKVLVNLAPGKAPQDVARISEVTGELAELLMEKLSQGWSVAPVAFDPQDVAPLRQLMGDIGVDEAVARPTCFEDYCVLARSASLSIGVRLHSAVFASACGVPNVLIAYRDKCRDFAETVGLADALVDMSDLSAANLPAIVEQEIMGGQQRGEIVHSRCAEAAAAIREFASDIARN